MPDDEAPAIDLSGFDRLLKLDPGEYQITKDDAGTIKAEALGHTVICEPHPKGTRIFHRNAIRVNPKPGQRERSRWLVVEHARTRIYFNDQVVIVTDKDLYP